MAVYYDLQLAPVAPDHTRMLPAFQAPMRPLAPLAHYPHPSQLRTDVNGDQLGIGAGGTLSEIVTRVRACEALRADEGVRGEEVGAVRAQVGREEGRLVGEEGGVAAERGCQVEGVVMVCWLGWC